MNIRTLQKECVVCVNSREPKVTLEQAMCSLIILTSAYGSIYVENTLCPIHIKKLEDYRQLIKDESDKLGY